MLNFYCSQGKECHVSWGWIAADVDLRVRGAGDKCCPAAGARRSPAPHTMLLAWGSCCGAGSQGECHTTLACVIPLAVGRDVPGGVWEEHTSAADPREWGAEQLMPERDQGHKGHETAAKKALLQTRSRYHPHSRCSRCKPTQLHQQQGWPLQLGMIQSV